MEKSSASSDRNNSLLRKKLNSLWKDKRTYKERLLLAAVPSFALCFTFIFFGPVELTAFNQASLAFDVYDITWVMAAAMLAAFAAMTLILAFVKGKLFNYLVTAVFALLVCGYLQGNVLNGQLGALTGEPINWPSNRGSMLLNFGLWVLIFLLPYCLLYVSKKNWRNVVLYGSALLIVMQAAALVGIFAGAEEKDNHYFSDQGLFDYSSEDNIIVFLVDMLDIDYVREVQESNSDFFDRLDGFTAYSNAISEFPATRPAANFMLTGYMQDAWQVPAKEYYDNSWQNGDKQLIPDLRAAGYRVELYSGLSYFFRNGSQAEEYVDNCVLGGDRPIDAVSLTKTLTYLSTYRYAPVIAKPFFWFYTEDINRAAFQNGGKYYSDAVRYDLELLYDQKISSGRIARENGVFKLYHFNGSHYPYFLNADGSESETPTSSKAQTMGCFEIIFRGLEKMKELGIYEDATIIISADHGSGMDGESPEQIGMFYKPSGKSGEPLSFSAAPVSVGNIPATVLKSAGLDYSNYGKALEDVGENDEVVRYFLSHQIEENKSMVFTYEIRGDASDFNNWKIIDKKEAKFDFYE